MSLLAVADDDDEADPGDHNKFCSNYDLDNDGVFDNDNTDNGEGYVCVTAIDSWLLLKEDEYKDDDILLPPGVFDTMTIQSFILISCMALSTIDLIAHTSTSIPFPTSKYFATPCSNPE